MDSIIGDLIKITSVQLSMGENTSIQTNSINLNLLRSTVKDIPTNISINSNVINMPNLCSIFSECNKSVIIQKVKT